ncbi:unnamed protein product [Kuraishia capsulata CBS 1993]|uniref:TOG domain-containing protein n=1 Tax=Kuraishia capsulata CBS 1993 TaxID=1382522 RepID=W6MFT4_9ASCO|nr:uncharacterized protein KUCA_T00000218001 [Kuraishia capsulata CBS 1993]CDK24258.1 unnamed protein product [Kuraishia capsulata CBS 1993]
MEVISQKLTWEELDPQLGTVLGSSSTKVRLAALSRIDALVQTKGVPEQYLGRLSLVLLRTFCYYQDPKSRTAVTEGLNSILSLDPEIFAPKYLRFILECSRTENSIAITDVLTLLDWCNQFSVTLAKLGKFDKYAKEIITSLTHLLEACCTYSGSHDHNGGTRHKKRVLQSAITQTKYTVMNTLSANGSDSYGYLSDYLAIFSDDKQSHPTLGLLTLLGILSQAAIDLLPRHPEIYNNFSAQKSVLLDYFSKKILLGKHTKELSHALTISGSFFEEFVGQKDVDDVLVPALEKAILRSSEIVFTQICGPLVTSLPSKIDLVKDTVEGKLLSQLFSAFKSSKETVRAGASNTMELILTLHSSGATPEILLKVVNEAFKAVKGVSAADQKVFFATTLKAVPPISAEVSSTILLGLLPLISKDLNETSLAGYLDALFLHATASVKAGWDLDDKVFSAIKEGLSDKRLNLRRVWFTSLAYVFDKDEKLREFLSQFFDLFVSCIHEAIASPLPTVTSKGIASCYVALYLLGETGFQSFSQIALESLSETQKPSVVLSHRVYSKLSTQEEQRWYLKALGVTTPFATEAVSSDLGEAWLFTIMSSKIASDFRREAAVDLKRLCGSDKQELIATSVVFSLQKVLSTTVADDDQLCLVNSNSSAVISSITQGLTTESVLEKVLSDLLMICLHPNLNIKDRWVGVCQRAQTDPHHILSRFSESVLSSAILILKTATADTHSTKIFDAAVSAISTAAYIAPEVVIPQILHFLEEALSSSTLSTVSEESIAIWKGEEGKMVFNVLQKKSNVEENKNSKDYETRKWEESIKKEISKKHEPVKKLTREEQLLVNEQLKKESDIRRETQNVFNSISAGVVIINSLVKDAASFDNASSVWFPVTVTRLLALLEIRQCDSLMGDVVSDSFLKLSDVISDRLGPARLFVGVATLRLYEIPSVPHHLVSEPLPDLLSRILFRVKFLSDQARFDTATLIYLLPLLIKVLDVGTKASLKSEKMPQAKLEFVEEDKEEEQLLLATDIIGAHAETFQDKSIPRRPIIQALLSLMEIPSRAKTSKECFSALCQHISVSISDADLSLIMSGAVKHQAFVRLAVLEALDSEFDLTDLGFSSEIWIACHDNIEHNAEIARTIWEESEFKLDNSSPKKLIAFLGDSDAGIRLSAARSIAAATEELGPEVFNKTLDDLIELYKLKKDPPGPQLDEFGLVIKTSLNQKDPWEERSGVALALKHMASQFDAETTSKIITFLVLGKALGDKESSVRQELQEAGVAIIEAHGATNVETLIPIFEQGLSVKDDGTREHDSIKESTIILYGALAQHLDSSDARLENIISRLLKTLDTPSEDVQFAVSECLAPLVPKVTENLGGYFDKLFDNLFDGKSLAKRRGAAYGIAGLVKGSGIKSLADHDVIRRLTDAADDKKNAKRREGVIFAFECLSQSLGELFEPYVIEILPIILKSLGDQAPEVREATDFATRVIMKRTTGYGVKKLIPLAVESLDDIAWRSKKGSVELLGSMAYLDPTQLSTSLSTIVPEIVGVLSDSHKEVRKAAEQALKRFGEVIRNPEIQALVPVLIKAIGDPTKYTTEALDALIETKFVHYIDGPSLALIIHVIHRGMIDRSATTKRKACKIVGNMSILVDSKDLIPYLPALVSELESAMVDPVPGTRATASRALGSLVEKLGEERFADLIPRLLSVLHDESKASDRLGSAQALAEVVSGLGINKLEEILPIILAGASNSRAFIRAGFMPLLLFLPVCFGSQFSPYLNRVIPPVLAGLADSDEDIRETALRAGRLIVKNYATKAVDLLLPELELGLSDVNYRIRLSSLELTGELLFQVTGITGKADLAETQGDVIGGVNKALIQVLGQDRRDRILALLFVCRSDTALAVRNAAVDIWKALVANTPRTVKEILPVLTGVIVRRLASSEETQRHTAAQTLGDLVRRVGGDALSQLLPTLEQALVSSDSDSKQGICVAINELIESSSAESVVAYQDTFVRIIRDALVDSNENVRESAATAFDALQEVIGNSAVDEVIPGLLDMLNNPESSGNALAALQEIMNANADLILPILIPTLTAPPLDAFKARALGSLAEVAGAALYKRLATIINSLIDALIATKKDDDKTHDVVLESLDKILVSVDSSEGLHPLLQNILSTMRHEDSKRVAAIYEALPAFFDNSTLNFSQYTEDLVEQLITELDNEDEDVVKNSFEALSSLISQQSKESLESLVRPAYRVLSITGAANSDLRAFTLPKGPNCVLPIFLQGLMYGTSEVREISAMGIANIVEKTPAANLKPFITAIVGPLIRVVGERFSGDVKASILYALNKLFSKIPQFLRPFIPQLQRTFVKSLSDQSNSLLRLRAAKALGSLIQYQPRVDPLVSELLAGAKSTDEVGVKTAMLNALLEVVNVAGSKMSEASKLGVLSLVEEGFSEAADDSVVANARLIGILSKILTPEEASRLLKTKVLESPLAGDAGKFSILTLNAFLKDSPSHVFQPELLPEIVEYLVRATDATLPYISDNAVLACGKLLLSCGKEADGVTMQLEGEELEALAKQLSKTAVKPDSSSSDTRRLSLVVLRTVSRFHWDSMIAPFISLIAPAVFLCVRDSIIPIRLAAEKCFLAIFNLVDDQEMVFFTKWFDDVSAAGATIDDPVGGSVQLRSIGDFVRRVAKRLAGVERERVIAGGDEEEMFSDRFEDEREIWSIGGVDLSAE